MSSARPGRMRLAHGIFTPETTTPCATNPDAWYDPKLTTGQGNPGRARDMCAPCPHVEQCLTAALKYEWGQPVSYRHGVWGGTTPLQRSRIEIELNGKAS